MTTIEDINSRIQKISGASVFFQGKISKKYEAELLREYVAIYKDIDKIIASLFFRFDTLSVAEMAKYSRYQALRKSFQDTLKNLFGKTNKVIQKAINESIEGGYLTQAYIGNTVLNVSLSLELVNAKALIANSSNLMNLISWKDANEATIQKFGANVRQTINRGIIQGFSYPKMARALKEDTVKASHGADRIIRTECHRAFEAGNLVGIQELQNEKEISEFKIDKIWIATLDERTRPDHADADGQIAKDGYFRVGGAYMEAPGMSGDPSQDINCRCTVGTQVNEKASSIRRDQLNDINIEYVTFTEWMNQSQKKAA